MKPYITFCKLGIGGTFQVSSLGTGGDLNVISYTSVGRDGHMISLLDIGPGTLVTPDRVDRFVGSLEGALVTIFFCHVVAIRIFVHPLHREGVGILIDTGHLAGNRSARESDRH